MNYVLDLCRYYLPRIKIVQTTLVSLVVFFFSQKDGGIEFAPYNAGPGRSLSAHVPPRILQGVTKKGEQGKGIIETTVGLESSTQRSRNNWSSGFVGYIVHGMIMKIGLGWISRSRWVGLRTGPPG